MKHDYEFDDPYNDLLEDLKDFSEIELQFSDLMREVFEMMAKESDMEIPKPDLSFMDRKDDEAPEKESLTLPSGKEEKEEEEESAMPAPPPSAAAAVITEGETAIAEKKEAKENRRKRKKNSPRRFGVFHRTGIALSVIAALLVTAGAMAVMLNNTAAYAGNPVAELFNGFKRQVTINPDEGSTVEDELEIMVTDENALGTVQKSHPELKIPENMLEGYTFKSLKIKKYDETKYLYDYEYHKKDEIVRILGYDKDMTNEINISGESVEFLHPVPDVKLYCENDWDTGGLIGTLVYSDQIITITGKLTIDDIKYISSGLK